MSRFQVRRVAVLGAGVMGAQIAAHLVNVKVPVTLFDLPANSAPTLPAARGSLPPEGARSALGRPGGETGSKNAIVTKAIEGLKKIKPSPLGVASDAALIAAANYEEHLEQLRDCDLIIEAIAERIDWKHDLYRKIAPFVAEHAILASNTSGLSITKLGEALPDTLKPRFCGIHFFNPPRYMTLVELIATPHTRADILDQLETFVTTGLGKGVIRAKDTPNFIANRIGIAGLLGTFQEVEKYGLSFDVVDDLTGKKLGRAGSGTFRTADIVGLDTLAHVMKTLQDNLDAASDPFYDSFATPPVLKALLDKGFLGQKTKGGFYKKAGREVMRFELESGDYVPAGQKADEVYGRMLKKPAAERLKLLRNAEGPQGRFLWAILRNSFHYAAIHLQSIAETARDVDLAMRWGFGMKQGPFELWQAAGWLEVAKMVQDDIDAGRALCKAPLPEWVFKGPVAEAGGVHTPQGSWNPASGRFEPARRLPVHARQHFSQTVLGSGAVPYTQTGTTVHEDDSIRLWTLPGDEDSRVLIASIKTKMHAISPELAEGLQQAVDIAERDYEGLVIWSGDEPFSVGADLQAMLPAFAAVGIAAIQDAEQHLQHTMMKLRYAQVPVIAAMHGARRWLRTRDPLRAPRGAYGKLHRSGGSGRGPDPGCGWSDLHRASRRREHCEQHRQGLAQVRHRRLHRCGHGQGGDECTRKPPDRLPLGQRHRRAAQGRGTACGIERGARDVPCRLAPAAQAAIPGRRSQCQGHDPGSTRQHARRWLHQRARLRDRQPHRPCGDGWRCGRQHPGNRGIPADAGARGLLRAARHAQDAGPHHGDAVDRQAIEELT